MNRPSTADAVSEQAAKDLEVVTKEAKRWMEVSGKGFRYRALRSYTLPLCCIETYLDSTCTLVLPCIGSDRQRNEALF